MTKSIDEKETRRRTGPALLRLLNSSVAAASTLFSLLAAAYFALTGLLQIVNFGWRQLMFDQYRMYPHYLELPFPQNLVQLENGHRPLIPILVRLAEIEWFSANQVLQIAVGTSCAFLIAAFVAFSAWRERTLSMPVRGACVATAFIGIFWLANSRMLLHGNELLHVYLLAFFVVLGALCVYRASHASSGRWMAAASAACIAATFCFGSGIAAFPALAVVAWVSRVPMRSSAWLAAGLAFCILVYLWVLPGNDGVRGMLDFRPVDSLLTAARWIASPWVNAWLGFADPVFAPWMNWRAENTGLGYTLSVSANGLQRMLHIDLRNTGAASIGLLGLFLVGAFTLRRAIRPRPMTCIESVSLTLALFGAAVAVVIGIGRLDYLAMNPDQSFADRYLPWSCIFWIGCTVLVLLRSDRAGGAIRNSALAFSIAVPVALLPSHASWAGWGEAVYKNSQRSAAAALSGVFDGRVFPNDQSASHEDVMRTLELLRQRRLAMFALPQARLLGSTIETLSPAEEISIAVYGTEAVTDPGNKLAAAQFQGVVNSGIRWVSRNGALTVIDDSNRICGFALTSFVGGKGTPPRLNAPRKRGFSGYIREYSASKTYRLVLLDTTTLAARLLAVVPPPAP